MTIATGGTLGATTGSLQVNNPNTGAGTAVVLNLLPGASTTTGSLSGTIATPSSGTNTATINNGGAGQNFTVNQTTAGDLRRHDRGRGQLHARQPEHEHADALRRQHLLGRDGRQCRHAGLHEWQRLSGREPVARYRLDGEPRRGLDPRPVTLQYTGTGAATLAKNINALGNGTDTVQNAGTGLLTLSGTLTKANTKLTLSGGASGINVTGLITGGTTSNFNSDLNVVSGTTTLSVANSYTGPTNVYNAGDLVDGIANAVPTGSVLTLGNAADGAVTNTFDLNGNNQTIAALDSVSAGGNSNVVTNSGGSGTNTLTLTGVNSDSTAVSSTYGGVIQDGATAKSALAVSGGTHTLSGANTYTGATTVGGGNLIVTGSLASGSAVTVGNNTAIATLSGTGTINGAVSLATTGSNVAHLAPGVNTSGNVGVAGTLVVKGALGLGANSDLDIDLSSSATTVGGGVNDLISMTGGSGSLTIGSGLTINYNILGGTSPLTTGTYTLINGISGTPTLRASPPPAIGALVANYSIVGGALDVSFSVASANPAVAYWSGASNASWATTTNFNTSATSNTAITGTLGSVTDVVFSTSTPTAAHLSTTLDAATSINSLHFNSSSGNVTIGSGAGGSASTLTIAAATTTGNSTPGINTAPTGIALDNGSGNVTISAPVVLGGNQSWSNAGANLLTVSGGVTGAHNLTLANNSTGGITISGGSLNNGGLVTNSGSGAGTTTINSVIGTNVTGVTQSSATSTLILGATNTYSSGTALLAGKTYVTGAIFRQQFRHRHGRGDGDG